MSFSFLILPFLHSIGFQGKGTPSVVEPATLRKDGLRRPNTSNFMPRTSREFQQHTEQYQRLSDCFQDVFDWITKMVSFQFDNIFIY